MHRCLHTLSSIYHPSLLFSFHLASSLSASLLMSKPADASRGAFHPSCQLASTLPPACVCGQPGAHVTEINTVSPAAAIADGNTRPVCGIGPINRAARG